MTNRLLLLCASALIACGPEVRATNAPPLDGAPTAGAQAAPPDGAVPPASTQGAVAAAASTTSGTGLTLPAMVYSDLDADVAARTAGVVERIAADLGDHVGARQVLAVLDDGREAARLGAASAALERARIDHMRADSLRQRGFVTQVELDDARYQLSAAEAALRVAEVELEYKRVLAPFAGVVTRRYAGQGRPVREGEPLFRVTALQPLRALARLPERDARGLRRGTTALLIADDGVQVEATVARIAPAVDPGSGTVEVIFNVPRPAPFLPGSSATLRLARPQSRK